MIRSGRFAAARYHSIAVYPHDWVTFTDTFRYVPIAYLASEHQIPTDAAYIARIPIDAVRATNAARGEALLKNHLGRDTLYVISIPDQFKILSRSVGKEHGVGQINGYDVIAPYWFANGRPVGPVIRDLAVRNE